MAETRVGTSGWRYAAWRGVFYPKGLPQRRELEYASRRLDTIEINGTFYALGRPALFESWHRDTPRGFRFAVKGGRFITHMKKLADAGQPLANFFASGILLLREKLGPILWQLPPSLAFDEARLDRFFSALPRTTIRAAELARRHDSRLEGRAYVEADRERRIRYAVEVRHESYRDERFYALLRAHGIALVVADTAGKFPFIDEETADFVYVRLHGSKRLYVSGYTESELDGWSQRISTWSTGQGAKDVYVYFDNTDVELRAPFDAMRLREKIASHAHRR